MSKATLLLLPLFVILITSTCVSQTTPSLQTVPTSVVVVPPTSTGPPALPTPTIIAVSTPTMAAATPTSTMAVKPTLAINDEYAIYKTVIESLYLAEGIELIVIKDQTETGLSPDETLDSAMVYVQENAEAMIEPDMINDYKTKNEQTHKLERQFSLDVDYVLISEAELNDIFKSDDGWSQFNSIYPNSSGFVTLSKVGFNPEMDQALVYTGNQADYGTGQGFYVLLTKKGGDWNIQSMILAWVS